MDITKLMSIGETQRNSNSKSENRNSVKQKKLNSTKSVQRTEISRPCCSSFIKQKPYLWNFNKYLKQFLLIIFHTLYERITIFCCTRNAKNRFLCLTLMLSFAISQQLLTTTAAKADLQEMSSPNTTSVKPSLIHFMGITNRIRNYTSRRLNIIDIYHYTANKDGKLLLSNLLSSSFLFYSDERIINLINRDSLLNKHHVSKMSRMNNIHNINEIKKYNKSQVALSSEGLNLSDADYFLENYDDYTLYTNSNKTNTASSSSCPSCQRHEQAKKENLESIKQHILMRLQLSQPPNITVPPTIPQKILDYFYKNFNYLKTSTSQQLSSSVKDNQIPKKIKVTTVSLIKEGTKQFDEDGDDDDDDDGEIMLNDKTDDHNDGNDNFASTLHMDEFYSHSHSIYVFPTMSRMRHNRKPDIFNFKFNSDPYSISSTILHVFIKGQDWINEQQRNLLKQKNLDDSIKNRQEIVIVVYRALRRPNTMNYTHTVKLIESRQKIPPGVGQWVEIEIKELSNFWLNTPNSTQSIVIRGMESWMRPFIVTEDPTKSKSLTMHIEILTKVKNRNKRNVGLDCHESDNEVRCCRYPLKVNFTNFGWNFIVAPQHFDAYFCNGECNVGYLEKYTHTHITSLTTSAKPCCSPQKLSPLALLYFDNNNKLMYSTIPNMSVEKCSCS